MWEVVMRALPERVAWEMDSYTDMGSNNSRDLHYNPPTNHLSANQLLLQLKIDD